MFRKAHLTKYRTGPSQNISALIPANTTLPVLSGAAVVGGTITGTAGLYSNSPTSFDRVWQVAAGPLFDQWTDIPGATSLTYVAQAGDLDKKLRLAERALNGYGFSIQVFSAPTGVVAAAPAASPPTITTPGAFSGAGSPVYVGDQILINQAAVTGATSIWYQLVRDGVPVIASPVATDQDTFPFAYTVTAEDVSTTFQLKTNASNSNPLVSTALSTSIGPITLRPLGGNIIDLGSADATEAFIINGLGTKWVDSGAPTQTHTVTGVKALEDLWNQTVKNAAVTERIEIVCDWDGIDVHPSGLGYELGLSQKTGQTLLQADNGGWIRFRNATGKKPAIGNRVVGSNHRGVVWEGLDFAGVSTTGAILKTRAALYITGNSTYPAEPLFIVRNCRVGKSAVTGVTEPSNTYCAGIWVNSTICSQIQIYNTTINGVWVGMKLMGRSTWVSNTHTMNHCEDNIKLFGHIFKSGYYAYVHLDRCTAGLRNIEYQYRTGHCDFAQTGTFSEVHLGYRCLYTDCINSNDHKYAGGGSQGFYNDDHYTADNLFCVRRCISMASSPNAFAMFSPYATYTSYIERCTFARTGMVPSNFAPDTSGATDNNPGVTAPVWAGRPQRPGVGVKVIDCIAGIFATTSQNPNNPITYTQYVGNVVCDFKTGAAGPRPEDIFTGRDFARGGPSVNGIADKFGFVLPNEATQAGLVADIVANFTPKTGYVGKGAPPPNPANYSAPLVG